MTSLQSMGYNSVNCMYIRVITIFVVLFSAMHLYAQEDVHPLYLELQAKKKELKHKYFELGVGLKGTQFKQNTAEAVKIGSNNLFPTIQIKGTIWALDWLGFDAVWEKGLIFLFGSKKDPNIPNSVLISPYWLDLGARFRYLFDKRDGSSFMALRLAYHRHSFPVTVYPQYISKNTAQGIAIGAQRKLAFNQYFGLDLNFDFLILNKLLDNSTISNSQSGIGYRYCIDLISTVIDNTGLNTQISLGYGQTSYISNLVGKGVNGDSRSLVNANHFEQTYSDLHIAFTARF